MAKKITTLFLRDDTINVAVTNGQSVEKWAIGPLAPGLVNQGMITDQTAVATAIRDLFRQNQIGGGKVIAGISGSGSLYRMITLPEMPDALLGEAVRREAKRVLPVSLDDVNLSYQAVPSANKGEKRLFLATYPKATTEAMVKTLKQAGLNPYLVDLAPLALARIPDVERCIIVNVRANQADIIIVDDRLPQLIRVLALPVESSSLAEKLPAVTEELSRTVIFYNSSHNDKPLGNAVPLYVCGELAGQEALWPKLVGRVNFSISVLPSPMTGAEGFPAIDFMVNMGLALKEFSAARAQSHASLVSLNILPESYHPRKVPVANILLPVVGVIAIGTLVYAYMLVNQSRSDTAALKTQADASASPIATQTAKIATLKSEVTRVTPLSAPIDSQVGQINATAAAFRSTMTGLQTNRARVDTDLSKKVVGLLPAAKDFLSLSSVDHDGSTITITGTAVSEDYIYQYTRKLRESGNYILVSSIQSNTETDANGVATITYNFSVTMK